MMTPNDFIQKEIHGEQEDEEVTLVGDGEVVAKEGYDHKGEVAGDHGVTQTEDGMATVPHKEVRASKRPRKLIQRSRIIRAPPILRRSHRLQASDEVRSPNKDGLETRAYAQAVFTN